MAITNGSVGSSFVSGASTSFSFTTASGSDRLLLVLAGAESMTGTFTVTYGGVALTQRSHRIQDSTQGGAIWTMDDPPVGSASLAVSVGAGEDVSVLAVVLYGVDSIRNVATPTGANSDTMTVTVASVSGDYVIGGWSLGEGLDTGEVIELETGQANIAWGSRNTGSLVVGLALSSKIATGTSTVLSWEVNPDFWSAHALALIPAAGGTPASLVVTTATATAQAEAVTLDAASKLTGTTATATGQAEAITFDAAGKITVAPATATAQGEAVTFDAAARLAPAFGGVAVANAGAVNLVAAAPATFPVTTTTATAEAEDSVISGQARVAATTATASAQAEAITFDASSKLTVTTATATAQSEAVALDANVAATLAISTATATSQGEAITLDAASRLVLAAATATAEAQSIAMGAGAAATFSITNATATAEAEAVTFNAAAKLTNTFPAFAVANAGAVNLTGVAAATFTIAAATAVAQAEGVDLAGIVVIIPDSIEAVRIPTPVSVASGSYALSGMVPRSARIAVSALNVSGGVLTSDGASGARTATIPATIHGSRIEGAA